MIAALAWLLFLLLVGIGVLVLLLVVGSLILFLPATLVALIVLLLTGSWTLAGLAFLWWPCSWSCSDEQTLISALSNCGRGLPTWN
jgi:hypothetical protein